MAQLPRQAVPLHLTHMYKAPAHVQVLWSEHTIRISHLLITLLSGSQEKKLSPLLFSEYSYAPLPVEEFLPYDSLFQVLHTYPDQACDKEADEFY